VKALRKRNETGLQSQSTLGLRRKGAAPQSSLPITLYKITRRERLNLYRDLRTPYEGPIRTLHGDAMALLSKARSQCRIWPLPVMKKVP